MNHPITHGDRKAYYTSALRLLQFVEQPKPSGRRLSTEADALWQTFKGDLKTTDRLDLLIRDADSEWRNALGARGVFNIPAVAEDEPFGAEWRSLDPVDAEELWRETLAKPPPSDIKSAISACADAWDLKLQTLKVDPISATDRLLVAGPSAIAATIQAFAQGRDLDWSDQALCIATPPAHRQLAAAANLLIGITNRTRMMAQPSTTTPDVPDIVAYAKKNIERVTRLVLSDDADPADATLARNLVKELGGAAE